MLYVVGVYRYSLHTDVVPTHVGCLSTKCEVGYRGAVCKLAGSDLVLATVWHFIGKFHVVVNCLVDLYSLSVWNYIIISLMTYSLDAVGVVHRKFRVVLGLDSFIDDTIDDTQGVEVELDAVLGTVGNLKVLFIEMIEELPGLDISSKWNGSLDRQSTYSRAIMSNISQ